VVWFWSETAELLGWYENRKRKINKNTQKMSTEEEEAKPPKNMHKEWNVNSP
jgi:hypothetical protein